MLASGAVLALTAVALQNPGIAGRLIGMDETVQVPDPQPTRPPVPVITAPVTLGEDRLVLEVVGTARAQRSVMLRAEAEGRVVERALAANARFEAGDVLMKLDDTTERLALELAETRLAEAQRIRDRFSRLQTTGAATAVRLDEVITAAEIARIEVARARRALWERTLRAPFAGVSGLPAFEPGDWIDSESEIASFDDRSVLLVEIDLPEVVLARVSPGRPVEARTPGHPDRVFLGEIAAIDSRIDAESRTAKLRVAIPNGADLLRPGASFTIRLTLEGGRYPAVPELALQFSRAGLYVWRVVAGTAERVDVRLIRRRAGTVLVEGDLADGDLVVVEGTQRLRPGRAVALKGVPAGAPR
ncbi:MAG: efflux RND transporter periplasmic adaptor subunit [Pikeienuella sp.]